MDERLVGALINAADAAVERLDDLIEQGDLDLTVEQELREQRADLIDALAALRDHAGAPPEVPCAHVWELAEDGYQRTWSTTIHENGVIEAVFSGGADFSAEGDGEVYLQCCFCLARRDLTPAELANIEYR